MTVLLRELLIEKATQEGFPLAGVVDIAPVLNGSGDGSDLFKQNLNYYDRWIQSGMNGAMEYLVRGRDRRADPRLLFPEAKSMLCVAIPYPRQPAGSLDPKEGPRYARYLQGKDYHLELKEKLERVMRSVEAAWGETPLRWKTCVDTSAVLERTWAALAGLGWIGKNTLLIHPKLGSYLFLAEVLINQETGAAPAPLPDYCGHCTRCLDQCPTQAFEQPRVLNSNRCVSYWSLEKRGALNIDDLSKKQMNAWIAGCDICQEVCPWNLKPSKNEPPIEVTSSVTMLQSWISLLRESPQEYSLRVKNSAMKRIKPEQFSRNLAIALKNSIELVPQNEKRELLQTLAELIQVRARQEQDPHAKTDWQLCAEAALKLQSRQLNS